MDNFATRTFNVRNEAGADRTIAKGADVTKLDPKLPDQQIEDFRHAGLVGAKPVEPTKAADVETKPKG